jgi:hypothetical protein
MHLRCSPRCVRALGAAAVLFATLWLVAGTAPAAEPVNLAAGGPSPDDLEEIARDAELSLLWREGVDLERREDLEESAGRYEAIAERLPDSAAIRWRIARNYWRHAEGLPVDDKAGRMHYFGLADEWADRSLALDADCAACVLWKLAAKGRLATTGGVMTQLGAASEIAEMIDRGIALHPTHVDEGGWNSTLGNLYYAGAAFYRIVPEWFWLKWVIGVRGDKERSLDYIRRALAITEGRVDYQVEYGAVLLCLGTDRDEPTRIAEGREVLEKAMHVELLKRTDALDVEHARILYANPERACGYSRDGWIDLSQARTHTH